MEITLETIYQQQQELKAEFKSGIGRLEDKVDSVEQRLNDKIDSEVQNIYNRIDSGKTWFVTLTISTVLVVTAIMTTFLNMR